MRSPASEKLEIIRTVEASPLPTRQSLKMLGIPSSTYYDWYARWSDGGIDALADHSPRPRSVWNRIPEQFLKDVVDFAQEHDDLTPRELAIKYTGEKRYFVSESSVYRILSAEDLITAPAHVVADGFRELGGDQLLLGHTKMDSTVRYLGVELEDALAIAEAIEF